MITTISIKDVATYAVDPPQVMGDLRANNYIFGSNGTGKTTIGRIIADSAFNANCQCTWKNGTQLEVRVLNRDFVEKSFDQLRGVFTLGETQKDTLEKIKVANGECDRESEKLAGLEKNLNGEDGSGGKSGDLGKAESNLQEKCWAQKQKHDAKLQEAFAGNRNDAKKFKAKVLEEEKSNTAELKALADLEKRAGTIFGEAPTKEPAIAVLNPMALLAHESAAILKKKVIGKTDVDIAAMIQRLSNSDWVRQGLPYFKANGQACPFCQQVTTEAFAASLNEYFDDAFEADSKAIDKILAEYERDTVAVQAKIDEAISLPGKFLDVEILKGKKALLDQRIRSNKQKLGQKKKEPSLVIELEPLNDVVDAICALTATANAEIAKHNEMVSNLATEKQTLVAEVWRYVLNELDIDLRQYHENKTKLSGAIAGIEKSKKETAERIRAKEVVIRDLEKLTTSIEPTIDAINGILARFGFDSFKLAVADDKKHYKLVRLDGKDALKTLSEGEKTFVVFLYFYSLLKGSTDETGMTASRVVVLDDPISSLDSDVLFIVSSLIKEICEETQAKTGLIKQVFILTHNVYFHKEVTYNSKRPASGVLKDESFWTVRKYGQHSKLERHTFNPIKTSYELLWMELRNLETPNPRVENTLRRIIEHYFTILGSINRDDICDKFEGQDKLICKSLFSWINAGSHSVFDDAHMTPIDPSRYLDVFSAIFKKTGHEAHYEMMMGQENAEVATR